MKVEADYLNNKLNVTLNKDDLEQAFQSTDEMALTQLMYNIIKEGYGKETADFVFNRD